MINPTFWLSLSTRLVTDNMYIYRYTEEIYTPAGVSPDILRPSVELGHIPQTPTSHTFFFLKSNITRFLLSTVWRYWATRSTRSAALDGIFPRFNRQNRVRSCPLG